MTRDTTLRMVLSDADYDKFCDDLQKYGTAAAMITSGGNAGYVSYASLMDSAGVPIGDEDGVCPSTIPLPL